MALVLLKLPLAGGLLLWTALIGLLPLQLPLASQPSWLSICGCFSGGVLLAIGILDMFVDVMGDTDDFLDELKKQHDVDIDYPLAQLCVCIGLLLVLAIEQIALDFKERSGDQSPLIDQDQDGHGGHHGEGHLEEGHHGEVHLEEHSVLRSLLLLGALSFHSVFGGLAIGLQNDATQVWAIFIGVVLHKSLLAFSLGVTLATSPLSILSMLASVLIFASSTPLGMVIGLIISDGQKSIVRDGISAFLQALACGTFLFITFFEILPHDLKKPNRTIKVGAILVGFGAVAVAIGFAPD